jgi:glycosyltransferase involved in cell wall biosynthesis
MSETVAVAYLSYDGMTDPLGQSQVIPYLTRLTATTNLRFTIISCEKPDRLAQNRALIQAQLAAAGIDWVPLPYTKRPPVFSTLLDLLRMGLALRKVRRARKLGVIHCRSYLPALLGLRERRKRGTPFIFDMRGLWADEKRDGGNWPQDNLVYRAIYRFFKRKEHQFLAEASATVSLTHAAVAEIRTWTGSDSFAPIEVIPCCADLDHFRLLMLTDGERLELQRRLDVTDANPLLFYVGSIGTWYMLDEMLQFFSLYRLANPHAVFVVLTPDEPEQIRAAARDQGVPVEAVRIQFAQRADLPKLLSLAVRATPRSDRPQRSWPSSWAAASQS